MKLFRILAACLCLVSWFCIARAEPPAAKDVTAAQVNGTWTCRSNTLKIWALGKGKLRVAFDGIYAYESTQGPMANLGEGSGTATISGDTAIFRPEGAEDECKITMKFSGGKLIVTQVGMCGFGHHVFADGTYKKTSGKKPNFEQQQ